MILSDALSHQPDHGIGAEHNNEDVTLLPEMLFIRLIDLKLQQRICKMKDIDPSIDPIYLALKKNTPSTLLPDLKDWRMERTMSSIIKTNCIFQMTPLCAGTS